MSCSMPASSARISRRRRRLAAEHPAQHRVEEEHRVARRAAGTAGSPRGSGPPAGQAAQLDLAGDPLDELVALLLGRARTGDAHAAAARTPAAAPVGRRGEAALNAW